MKKNNVYSIPLGDPELNIAENLKWLFDSDESEEWGKKKKKRKAKKKAKKEARKAKKKARKKAQKKAKKRDKQLQREFKYRLAEKSADVTLGIISDFSRMYAQNKFLQSGSNK